MKIAVDWKSLDLVKKDNNEYVYLFNDESYDDLKKLNMHCIFYKECDYVDINLTDYEVNCLKKCKKEDKDWDKLPQKKDYNFAIIVPSCNNDHGDYNGKSFFRNCIESILNQTYKNFKLIIVDDCSTDTSIKTAEEYQAKDDRVILIKNKRKKYNGGSRNVGIEYALDNLDFDYFCFLDSDDWWINDKVLDMINHRLFNHELMTLGVMTIRANEENNYRKANEAKTYEDLWSLTNNVWCTAWARVIRKDKIVYFCESTLMEDRVWTYRLADNINFNNIINSKEIVYCWNRSNNSNSVSQVRNYFWNASAYCHIGNQLQLLGELKHKEFAEIIKNRIRRCKNQVNEGIYSQD